MIYNTKIIHENILIDIEAIKNHIYTSIGKLGAQAYVTKEPVPYEKRLEGTYNTYKVKDKWGDLFDCAWFHLTGKVPEQARDKKVVLLIDIGGEGCIYDENGCPKRGLTNVKSHYDYSLGMPGKRVYTFTEKSSGNELIDLWMDAGCNDLFGELKDDGRIRELNIAICNDEARGLYYDLVVLENLLNNIDSETPQYCTLLYKMQEALRQLCHFTDEEYKSIRTILKEELDKAGGTPYLSFNAIGHAHIDLAWLWPIRETKRKGARTFSTVLDLMNRYPDYQFGASQCQLYKWIEEDYPQLFEKIQDKVREGRWEVQGGMWVESDTNIPTGESLVRQFLYGKRYFRDKFDQDMKILWLPDVFGYSASLPQIMKKSGIDYFTTIKISWSKINKFPYHTFKWEGLDESEVLVHMPPEGNYLSAALPESFANAGKRYMEKGVCDRALCLFGIGDGGGGPGAEHLERLQRQKNLSGLYPVKQTSALEFFHEIDGKQERYPHYKGELYVEAHQGTLTTQAWNKKYNRVLENLLRETELLCSLAYMKENITYPKEQLQQIWEEVLLYQFHDILPGSSIKRVYDESVERYALLIEKTEAIKKQAIEGLCQEEGKSIFNQLPWERQVVIEHDGEILELMIPPLQATSIETGKKIVPEVYATENTLENTKIRVVFDEKGNIISVWDKVHLKEIIKPGYYGNELRLYPDRGDAWDFDFNYRTKKYQVFELQEATTKTYPTQVVRKHKYTYGNTTLWQEIVLEADSSLIDYRTEVDWQEKELMLRAEFPLTVRSKEVTCDIQFGHIKRTATDNTTWDSSRIEVCAHKWIDISEPNYGVSLINNCKYGHYAKYDTLSINLLRAQKFPCEYSDHGQHSFSYALYPHANNVILADVEKKAYEYNNLPIILEGNMTVPYLATVDESNIILETVKMNEDEEAIIIRLYENKGQHTTGSIRLNDEFKQAILTNLIEDELEILSICDDNKLYLQFKPFEIHTIKLKK